MTVSLFRMFGKLVPGSLRSWMRLAALNTLDKWDSVRQRRDPLVPPRRLIFVGKGNYSRIGDRFLKLFISPGGLRPNDTVVDIGCGCGRMSRPLATYLDPLSGSSYVGLDVSAAGISWCSENISPRFPHFQFIHLDLFNSAYNPKGKGSSAEVTLPIPSDTVHFVIAVSLFTSMLPMETLHYLAEAARLLKPGGRLFASIFLLDDESRRLISCRRSSLVFAHPVHGGLALDPARPEAAVALDETFFFEGLERAGLQRIGPVHYGRWSGREGHSLTHEDVLVAGKVDLGPSPIPPPLEEKDQ